MGLLDDARRNAEAEHRARTEAIDEESNRLQEFCREFLAAVTQEKIPPRQLLETVGHAKEGLLRTKSWETLEPVGQGWLVEIHRYEDSSFGFAKVVTTDGRALSSTYLKEFAAQPKGSPHRAALHALDGRPGAGDPLVGRWDALQPHNLKYLVRACGDYLAAAAENRPIKLW
ncbi:hypothetical protein [Propionicicella superfundia]|uniref:hypothetical protein n=1 Tax=Propionicicella superfundia TaxID=348582 RepID=UPI0012ECB84B|nr:hypothetical protein [Propionicicella superfundia]